MYVAFADFDTAFGRGNGKNWFRLYSIVPTIDAKLAEWSTSCV